MKLRAALLLLATAVAGALVATGSPASASVRTDSVHTQAIGTYRIDVQTGDLDGAGTDARVRITVFGSAGQSPGTTLDNGDDNFERGKLDHFGPYKWVDIGTPDYIMLGKGQGSNWYPAFVTIYVEHLNQLFVCHAREWYYKTSESETRPYGCQAA
jgi:hypothetical protein